MKRKIIALIMSAAITLSAAVIPAGKAVSARIEANAAGSSQTADYARTVAEIVNKERKANGLAPLKFSPELCAAADIRAKEIQRSFSHTRPDGQSCFTALKESGISYRSAAENIAYGQRDPEDVMRAWMNSSGHRANILSANSEYIGVGVAYSGGVYYWTQFFTSGSNVSGEVVSSEESVQTTVTTSPPKQTTTEKTTSVSTQATTKKTTAPTQTYTQRQTTTKRTTAPTQTTTQKQTTTKKTTAPTQTVTQPQTTAAPSVTSVPTETTVSESVQTSVQTTTPAQKALCDIASILKIKSCCSTDCSKGLDEAMKLLNMFFNCK